MTRNYKNIFCIKRVHEKLFFVNFYESDRKWILVIKHDDKWETIKNVQNLIKPLINVVDISPYIKNEILMEQSL